MNCAYHADQSAVAYCRTCGKPLCANCTRPVRGVIYCEDCLGARMAGTGPASAFPGTFPGTSGTGATIPAAGTVPPPPPGAPMPSGSGPNPTVAGILGGVFPFGVGAVYTGQYAKGLAHLAIFGLLIAGCNVSNSDVIPALSGIGIAFFVVYQIFDAVRSARAIQAGLPAPDPYGLGASFGGGARLDSSKIPTGAIILILLGVLFLLHTAGFFEFGFDRFWPLLLIGLGAWLLARNLGMLGSPDTRMRMRGARLMGPAMLLTIGTLFLVERLDGPGFHRTWPLILLVAGGVKLFERSSGNADGYAACGGVANLPPQPPAPPNPPEPPSTPSEVNHG
jgi:Domain of unknown function (DUF5668)/B-box zinc finger